MASVKVSRKHQIVVPAAVRRRLGIRAGDRLEVGIEGEAMVLRSLRRSAVADLVHLAPELWQGGTAGAYVRELRDEWTSRER